VDRRRTYSLQLYFDFSGYSDMAVGLSRMFGVRLPFNFDSPYKSRSVIDFWRRWHITLSRFLRDYVYVPLGGNRRGPLRRYANIMATMLVGGLWHGANWTFVAWGALHGLMLLVNHAWRAAMARLGMRAAFAPLAIVSTAATFLAVTIAWVLFRAADFPAALLILEAMTSAPRGIGQWPVSLWPLMTGCLAIAPRAQLAADRALDAGAPRRAARGSCLRPRGSPGARHGRAVLPRVHAAFRSLVRVPHFQF
jgi:D-alanyl-lipoteichoic acid acyltransferase DltB (MBOAT superfamily)